MLMLLTTNSKQARRCCNDVVSSLEMKALATLFDDVDN